MKKLVLLLGLMGCVDEPVVFDMSRDQSVDLSIDKTKLYEVQCDHCCSSETLIIKAWAEVCKPLIPTIDSYSLLCSDHPFGAMLLRFHCQ